MQFITKDFIEALRCPATGQHLSLVQGEDLASINREITGVGVRDASGSLVQAELQSAMVTADRIRVYPIEEGIPVLLKDRSICLKTPLA